MKYNMSREHISYLTRITKLRSEEYVVQKILSTTETTAKTHIRSDFSRARERLAWVRDQWHTKSIITCCLSGASEWDKPTLNSSFFV